MVSAPTPYPPTKQTHKAWWNHFTLNPKSKRDPAAFEGPYRAEDNADHPVFGKPLKESLKYASVQISTANANGELYVWGYIPVVVAKCGLYLKENATEVPGTFRVSGSNKRMRDLQAVFETPPRYGKSLDWKKESYTTHDVASVFRRYLTQMPEPVIPYDMYHLFRDAIAKEPFNQEEVIATYKNLIRRMPKPNQYLLLYVLDLLSVFARKSDKNLMTATNLAVIFRPGILSHPSHEMSPQEHALSQRVLEFLIAQQDWFMLDISPPTPPRQSESYEGPSGNGGSSSRGGSGGNGNGNGGQGGGRWRENTNTPSRQGTADTTGGSSGGGGAGAGAPTTQNAAWHSIPNAEAGPSRQRTLTLPDRSGSSPSPPHSSTPWTGSIAYAPPLSPHQPAPQHRRQRSISHSPSRSQEKQAMMGLVQGQGQFAEHMWSHSSSLPPSPLSATFPSGPSSGGGRHGGGGGYGSGQGHVKSASAGTNANANTSASATPIYSRFSHPPSSPTQTPTHGYEYGEHDQWRPQTHAPLTPTSQSQRPSPSPNANQLYHHHQPQHHPQSPSQTQPHHHQPRPQYHHHQSAPLPSASSDVDEHMIIPSSSLNRPSSPLSEDDVSIAPFGNGEGGLDGGWKLVHAPVPSPSLAGVENGWHAQGQGGRHGHGHGGFLALKVGRGKDKERKMMRRRTAVDPSELAQRAAASQTFLGIGRENGKNNHPLPPTPPSATTPPPIASGGANVTRSKTLPSSSRRKGRLGRGAPADLEFTTEDEDDFEEIENVPLPELRIGMGMGKENEYSSSKEGVNGNGNGTGKGKKERRVLKKQRRVSVQTPMQSSGTVTTTPVSTVALRS